MKNQALKDWLARRQARALWQARVRGVGMIDAWQVGRAVVLTMTYAGTVGGFEIWTPSLSNNIDATLADADKRCGFEPVDPADQMRCDRCGRTCTSPGGFRRRTGLEWQATLPEVLGEHTDDCTWAIPFRTVAP